MSNSEKQKLEKTRQQEYLEYLVQECKDRVSYSESLKERYPELFDILEGEYSDEDIEFFFDASAAINDTKTSYAKLSSFIDFCKKLGIDIDITVIQDVKGFEAFIGNYEAFPVLTVKKGDSYVVDNSDRQKLLDSFKKNFDIARNVIRNQDIS